MNISSITTNVFGTAIFHTDDGRALAYGGVDADGDVAVIQVHDETGALVDGPRIASPNDPLYAELHDALVKGPGGDATWTEVQHDIAAVLDSSPAPTPGTETHDPNPSMAPSAPAAPPLHSGPLTLTTAEHAQAKSLLARLGEHIADDGRELWHALAALLRHA